ncbi:hypothetical protein ATCC90586_000740 [Pythium insidiosum]|nr:hypothetical protein ATCC90586_000740 [Pythium insidiosum]
MEATHQREENTPRQLARPPVAPTPRDEWSLNHLRLLYMLSRFAMYPTSTDCEEKWLRNLPLLVLVYEAIVAGILDYDYSPVCTNIVKNGRSKRVWMNISQDAKAAIDDLREHELLNALKTCSEDFQPSTAYQVTPRGTALLETLQVAEKKAIDSFLVSTTSKHELVPTNSGLVLFDSALLKITFDVDDGKFRFLRVDGSVAVSRVTEVEAVSYVSSPYLPACLMRNGDPAFSSNANQTHKCKQGQSGIKDVLSVSIVLSDVRVMVGEWIPFGRNQIVMLNDRLGSLERCQGGLFTSELDQHPTRTTLHLDPGLTKIAITDFEFDSYTNFEADIHAPHGDGIVQIESFGMHLNGDGTIIYGMFIDAIMDKAADTIFVDHLSRLLVDVDLDSSKIINDLLSPHQRSLMDMLFMDDARSRNKFSLITARAIQPALPVSAYMDRGERENELKQILGEIHSAYDLTEQDKIIIGRDGMLLLGPNAHEHEPLIVAHLALLSRELFIRFFFKRTFVLDNQLSMARTYMHSFEKNPEALGAMRKRIDRCSRDLILLEEILELLRDSLHSFQLPRCPTDPTGRLLFEQLELKKTHVDLEIRCKDLAKLLRGFRAKIKQVQSQNGNTAKLILESIVQGIERNMGVLAEATGHIERSAAASFDVLLLVFAAIFAFEIIDRITDGKLLGVDGDYLSGMQWARDTLIKDIVAHPGVWFALDVSWMVAIVGSVHVFLAVIVYYRCRTAVTRVSVNKRVNVAALEQLLHRKLVESRTSNFHADSQIVKVIWIDKTATNAVNLSSQPPVRSGWDALERTVRHAQWHLQRLLGPPLRTQLTFDIQNKLLLDASFQGSIDPDPQTLFKSLMEELRSLFDVPYEI